MKYTSVIRHILLSSLAFALFSCTGNDSTTRSTESPYDKSVSLTSETEVVSRKAYERGLAAGREILSKEAGSREREQALIEVHGMVTALERNGFRQSALDFSRGVETVLCMTNN